MTATSTEATREPAEHRDQVARLLASLRQVRVIWREITTLSFPGGVSGPGVLRLLDQGGSVRVSDLAACGHVGVSTMSRHVAELTAAGLVERDLAPDDARTHLVRLTDDLSALSGRDAERVR